MSTIIYEPGDSKLQKNIKLNFLLNHQQELKINL